MELALNGIKVSVADTEIAHIVRNHLLYTETTAAPAAVHTSAFPAIGDACDGGLYAGLTLHNNQPQRLILLPEDAEPMKWKYARAWAQKQGAELPTRMDQLVLWQNLKAQFQSTAYWSAEQSAGAEGYAWCQGFDFGLQTSSTITIKLRARAVRRIPIE